MKYLKHLSLVVLAALAVFATGCADSVTPTAAPVVTAFNCQGTYQGAIDAPDHERRIANRNQALADRGIALTGDDSIDNPATGGGGVDGGVYLEGAFGFEADEACNIVKGDLIIHGYRFDASGTVSGDGTYRGNAYVNFSGKVTGTSIAGDVTGGPGEEYHNGILRGTFTPNGKL